MGSDSNSLTPSPHLSEISVPCKAQSPLLTGVHPVLPEAREAGSLPTGRQGGAQYERINHPWETLPCGQQALLEQVCLGSA